MREVWGNDLSVQDGELLRRQHRNREYMMSLESRNLLMNFCLEAGRVDIFASKTETHGGWESPTCQVRGHFLGHWLSAAALTYYATRDLEIKAKADAIVEELALCQADNGGEWVAPIPEKYLHWIAKGKPVWAPHYTIHKVFMGLLDMADYADSRQALDVAVRFSHWFDRWSETFTREQFDDILDVETGGMLEIWVQLYERTKDAMYLRLMDRYYRGRLFDRLLAGGDPLTNMHANTTIPEVLGCARAYDATGDQKWKSIAEAYWRCAVDERGWYATGGQTCGEIWSPKMKLGARLGEKAQEHCTVYNMMRLAAFLFRWTKDARYIDYIERNRINGIMAQAYWQGHYTHGAHSDHPDQGLLTYFLPLNPGAVKGWASETQDFFCCHGTLVQANAQLGRNIVYQDGTDVYLCQYIDSTAKLIVGGHGVTLTQKRDTLAGSFHISSDSTGRQIISDATWKSPHQPDRLVQYIRLDMKEQNTFAIKLRMPWWLKSAAEVDLNGGPVKTDCAPGAFVTIERIWQPGDVVRVSLPMGVTADPLPDDPHMVAFLYGPTVLAGLCDGERELKVDTAHPETVLVHDNEREWGNWMNGFKAVGQRSGLRFIPLNEVGYEKYCVYFPVVKRSERT